MIPVRPARVRSNRSGGNQRHTGHDTSRKPTAWVGGGWESSATRAFSSVFFALVQPMPFWAWGARTGRGYAVPPENVSKHWLLNW